MKVELIYESACPNVASARSRLLIAFRCAHLAPVWREWDTSKPETPKHLRCYGSPTILINGKDVGGGESPRDGDCCRLYSSANGYDTAPSVAQIAAAVRQA